MSEHKHRYTYDDVRAFKEDAERHKHWTEASYWLQQQLAIEHREEAEARHETTVYLQVVTTIAAIASAVCAVLLVLW